MSSPGGRAAEATELPVPCRGDPRAVRLTRAPDVEATLLALAELLGEVGIALVGLACGVYQEALYWASVEAIDAADEARDRVLDMLRALAESSGHCGRGSAAELR